MRVFVDVEWENETTRELVSLALVTQDGQHRFYAERTPLPKAPSNFVREVVCPLLERGPSALPDGAFSKELRVFLASLKDPLLIADSDLDFILLSHALRGFGQQDLPSAVPYRYMLATFGDVLTRIEEYLENRPHAKVRRHHAMVIPRHCAGHSRRRSLPVVAPWRAENAHFLLAVTPKLVTFAPARF